MSESEHSLTEGLDPLIVDHGDGKPTPAEDDPVIEAAAESDAPPEEQSAQSDPSDEQKSLALTRGWVEKAKFHGKPSDWIDAPAYNQRYEQIMPVVTRENRRMREEMRTEREERQRMATELADLRKRDEERQEASRTIHYQTLTAQKLQAQQDQDWQRAAEIGDQLLDMKLDQKIALPRVPQAQPQKLDPVVQRTIEDFVADNPAFVDEDKKVYLAVAAKQLAEAGTSKRGRELLDEAAELAQSMFPTKFKQAQRRPAMAEMNGAPARSNGAVRTWADLKPDEARKQEQFIADSFPKMDAKQLAGARQRLLKELPPTAFRR